MFTPVLYTHTHTHTYTPRETTTKNIEIHSKNQDGVMHCIMISNPQEHKNKERDKNQPEETHRKNNNKRQT